eukprot:7495677-Heterocapsa_arctica.AAC.1
MVALPGLTPARNHGPTRFRVKCSSRSTSPRTRTFLPASPPGVGASRLRGLGTLRRPPVKNTPLH